MESFTGRATHYRRGFGQATLDLPVKMMGVRADTGLSEQNFVSGRRQVTNLGELAARLLSHPKARTDIDQ